MKYPVLVLSIIFFSKMTVAAYDIKEYFPLEGSWTYRVIKDNESVEEKVESHTNEVIEDTKTLKFIYSENNYKYCARYIF